MNVRILLESKRKTALIFCGLIALLWQSSLSAENEAPIPHLLKQEITLMKAIHHIGERYQVLFNYDRAIIADIKVDYEPSASHNVDEAISAVLENTDLKYQMFNQRYVVLYKNDKEGIESLKEMIQHFQKIVDNKNYEMVIRPKVKPVHLLISTFPRGRLDLKKLTFSVSGTVVDENGEPLIGVNIQVMGTNKGTATDFDGRFTLEDIDENAVLMISYIGYQAQEVSVAGKTELDIMLVSDSQLLDEVVVTAFDINKKKRSIGYSVGQLDNESLNEVPAVNLTNALTGKIAGLQITNTEPGVAGNSRILIRGMKSLNADDSPLIVVNSIPVGTDASVLSDLDQSSIKSMSVLKGPNAAALYGTRAGNGAIVITTMDGSDNISKDLGIHFNSSYTATQPYHFIPLQQRFTSGFNLGFQPGTERWWGPEFGSPEAVGDFDGNTSQLQSFPDNQKNFYETGSSFNNSVSFSKNYEDLNVFLSLSDMRSTDVVPGSELRKNSAILSATYNLSDNFTIRSNFIYQSKKSDRYRPENDDVYPDYDIFYLPNYVDVREIRDDYWEVDNVQQKTFWGNNGINNPWFSAYEQFNTMDYKKPMGTVGFQWDIQDNLELKGNISQYSNNHVNTQRVPYSFLSWEISNPLYGVSTTSSQENNYNLLLTYSNKINKLDFNLTGGGDWRIENAKNTFSEGEGLVLPGLFTLANIDRNSLIYTSELLNRKVYSALAIANFDYNNMVFLELTGRNDWSSTLPVDNRSYFYPSTSLSIIPSNIFNLPSFISSLKIRGSWANVGKDTDPYNLSDVLDKGSWNGFNNYTQGNVLINSNLLPENILSWEAGVNIDLFDYKTSLEFTAFRIDDQDQLIAISIPASTGFLSSSQNAGDIRSEGIEIQLSNNFISTNDIDWNMNVNLTKYRNTVLRLPDGVDRFRFWGRFGVASEAKVGEALGDLWIDDMLRVEEGPYKGLPILNAVGRPQTGTGNSKHGNALNDLNIGFQTDFRYKRFSFNFNVDLRTGGKYYSESMSRLVLDGRTDSWYKGEGSSTFSGILDANSFGGDRDQLASEIRNNPDKYDGIENGMVYVGGRNEELGGYFLESTGEYNGVFFPGVRIDPDGGGYIENFGGEETSFFAIQNINEGDSYFIKGVHSWLYDASYMKLRSASISYLLPERFNDVLRCNRLSLSGFVSNVILWTKAKNHLDPEYSFRTYAGAGQSGGGGVGEDVRFGRETGKTRPWMLNVGIKLSVQF